MKVLTISDNVLPQLEQPENLTRVYQDAEAIISCGDMPGSYLDLIASVLTVPLIYVRGNHDIYYTEGFPGGIDLHRQFFKYRGLLFAGLEGCIRYNREPVQYTESEMFWMVLGFAPRMLLNRARWGFGVDVMVTHSPPRDIHDMQDRAHRGFRSFRLLLNLYKPRYLLHGHVDTHDQRRPTQTHVGSTEVINVNPMRYFELEPRKGTTHGSR